MDVLLRGVTLRTSKTKYGACCHMHTVHSRHRHQLPQQPVHWVRTLLLRRFVAAIGHVRVWQGEDENCKRESVTMNKTATEGEQVID